MECDPMADHKNVGKTTERGAAKCVLLMNMN